VGHQFVTNNGPFRPILSEMPRKIAGFSLPRLDLDDKQLTLHKESSPHTWVPPRLIPAQPILRRAKYGQRNGMMPPNRPKFRR
jgi:hypothetical protein